VLACGASGEEVKAAFATPEEQRDGWQSKIVRVIIQNGGDMHSPHQNTAIHAGRLWCCFVANKEADGLATCFKFRQRS